jgi:hypothetical protein
VIADCLQDHAAASHPDNFAHRKTRFAPAKPSLDQLPFIRISPLGLSGQSKKLLLQFVAGVVHGIAHLHGRALGADPGKGQTHRRVRTAHPNLLLRDAQGLRRDHAEQIVSALADLRRVMLDGYDRVGIH